MATRKPKAPAVPVAPVIEAGDAEVPVPKPKPKAKGKPKAKAPPAAVEKPVAPEPQPKPTPPKPVEAKPVEEAPKKPEAPLSPEDAKIAQYFQNPKSKVSGKFKTKVLQWIDMYETIGAANEVWKKPNPVSVWETPKHEFHAVWTQFMEGMSVSDAEALICVALDNRVAALEQMLASWIATKLRTVIGQPDLMIKMLEGTA